MIPYNREETLGDYAPRRRATNLQDSVPNRRGKEELYLQGVSGTGSDADENTGPLPTPEL